MADTVTRYLKLKVADNLSADAKYNLDRIDGLGATTITDSLDTLQVRSRGNVVIEAESLDIGGAGTGGTISLGTLSSKAAIETYLTDFRLRSALSLVSPTNDSNKLLLALASGHTGEATVSLQAAGNATLTVPTTTGEILTDTATQIVSNKSISGSNNTLSNIAYSSLLLTGSIVNADIASGASIADTKLATITTAGKVANSATTATSSSAANTIVARDANGKIDVKDINIYNLNPNEAVATNGGNDLVSIRYSVAAEANSLVRRSSTGGFSAGTINAVLFNGPLTGSVTGNVTGNVTGSVSGTASNVTGIVALANGGTGNDASDKTIALLGLLPTTSGNAEKVLRINTAGTGLEWYAASGTGTVTSVDLSMPAEFTVTNNPITTTGTLTVSKASQAANLVYSSPNGTSGVPTFRSLVEADIPTLSQNKITNLTGDLSGKEPTITAGTTSQYWRGDKSWQTLNTGAVPENGNLYFTDTRAKTAAVVNSTAGNETDQAASVSAMKAYAGGSISYTWATVDGVTKSITHSLNKATVSVTVYDENGEDILVDTIDRTSNNAVSLTSSVAPTGNWTVVIRP